MKLILPVSRGAGNVEAAVTAASRIWEERGFDSATIIHVGALDAAKRVKHVVEEYLKVDTGIEDLSVHAIPEVQGERTLPDILRRVFREKFCDEEGVVVISSAGRRLAASTALATVSAGCRLDVAHVHFYWGPWTGLVYPYVPRRLEPIILMHSVVEAVNGRRSAASRFPDLTSRDRDCRGLWGGDVPPLRCSVAELARRLNNAQTFSVAGPPLRAECGMARIEVEGIDSLRLRLCDPQDVANSAARVAKLAAGLADRRGEALVQLPAWMGAARLRGVDEHREAGVIVDTNLIYFGIHNSALEGLKVYIPECAVLEVQKRVANAVKRGGPSSSSAVADVLAYLALQDLLASGASIIPSGPPPCDVGMTRIDLTLLEGKTLATGDSGAYKFWKGHPIKRVASDIVQASFEPHSVDLDLRVDPSEPVTLARPYYALYQGLISLALLAEAGVSGALRIEVEDAQGGVKKVKPPLGAVRRFLGLERG
ncbi:hypothetical protein apy_11760 [Aeropyrum pernix]|uniref:Uncharacterized protein n=1 Tax=Aeropyrum pernix TaxID=56636 RepID=A0A401HAH2_AERPX|nr:hypothetical protein [Aeropyrum pernix]GBF09451.1 hypothetical protein apy_11760 [Aeropyrum pernix]